MLDQTTKRKIDTARQILVGKVPDPKQQVDQITNALVYKFMDDMDKENEEVGLKAQFFVGEYQKYAWTKLFDNKLSGQGRLDLYVQAITNMSTNPHIPQLFRDIFKGVFLPYNDPRTLSLFLREINEFHYDNSENLGNAFEYLLSILGSQGDAGQFRTPRHIIDFIVEVVHPKKNETILDPACGTAGFLISAYKHILKTNKEKPLTPDEKLKLMNSLAGYDISPDMVKLARVNMYLHGSPEPKIHEYDSLTSENRWDEMFDVILANPPFMTPKGGIDPHKRFSVQAKRAEVLFVDYIVEHLTIKGRAGIIVPEGIIFQTANAYKSLRKKLVEDGLYAVVSLPSGVFQPYSGVKTSILFFDKELRKETDEILFIRVDHDGFDLGAQRRPIDQNDLPETIDILKKWKEGKKAPSEKALWVKNEKIAENGEYNLTASRYIEVETFKNQKWPMVELGEVCEITTGKKDVNQGNPNGKYPFFTCAKDHTFSNSYSFDTEAILVAGNGDVGAVKYYSGKFEAYQRTYVLSNFQQIDPKYLFAILSSSLKEAVSKLKLGNTMPYIRLGMLRGFGIPLPPLSVQKEIVEQIEVKQKAIDAAKEVIRHLEREREYFGEELRKIEGVEWVELGEVCEIKRGTSITRKGLIPGEIPVIAGGQQPAYYHNQANRTGKTITVSGSGAYAGFVNYFKTPIFASDCSTIQSMNEKKVLIDFIYFVLNSKQEKIYKLQSGMGQPHVYAKDLKKLKIPLPSLEVQKKLVAEAEKVEEAIDANKRLITIMEGRINDVMKNV